MNFASFRFLPLLVALFFSACDQSDPRTENSDSKVNGGFAVVDLDEVARRLGRDLEISAEIRKEEEEATGKVSGFESELVAKLQERRDQMGESPDAEKLRELGGLQQEAARLLQVRAQEARAEIARKQAALVQRFREEVRPHARDAAAARGLGSVFTKNDLLLVTFDGSDITEDVVVRMIKETGRPASEFGSSEASAGDAPTE